ncbi:hypothetical protein [Micromonospora siamensis]|uniref:Uncharacterized protein n=1 Tax=Micromonospora siamensis TaxID=299152 RepID=A0A1C5GR47_9ACTN|nr:hypothetical protein [Micromonospora siamensis]SCG36244.1 hypothetical protein GA0074704_0339 [Micromonospora siamensis]
MGEQAVTGAEDVPAPERTPDATGDDAAAATGSGDAAAARAATEAPPAPPAGEPVAKEAGGTPQNRTTDVTAGPGGVMTDEVGVVTGELTLRTEYVDGKVTLRVQYKDADEWYAVTGGTAPLADPAGLDAVHAIAVALLNRPEG